MGDYQKRQAESRIISLAGQGHDLISFWKAANEAILSAVPHYMNPCWYTLDPSSLLVTSHYNPEMLELPSEWLAHEYYEDDFHKIANVARSKRGFSTVHEATGGDPSRSLGWNLFVRPYGGDQELLLSLRTPAGAVWGMMGLYREPGQPLFSTDECSFLLKVAPYLAEGARRGLLVGEATDPEGPGAPGLVILKEDWTVESLTPGVAHWLDDLPGGDWTLHNKLPPSLLAVAGRTLRTADKAAVGEVAMARVMTRSGRWMVLHGAALATTGVQRCAIIIEPGHPARIASLLMVAYGLTDREQELTRMVLQGNSTGEIATALGISVHTVQQHLKSIFDKTDVRSRRELIGRVFFSHYEPRLRDNEQRALMGQPLRGGPVESSRTN
ncbi:MAG: helix-turn-helix transcriptional regulator [Trueperaceae bacterium]|nr:helix-turn-helix transcriptional regulator [Trueperaceae bacterium]